MATALTAVVRDWDSRAEAGVQMFAAWMAGRTAVLTSPADSWWLEAAAEDPVEEVVVGWLEELAPSKTVIFNSMV